jgi:hypothetical protein
MSDARPPIRQATVRMLTAEQRLVVGEDPRLRELWAFAHPQSRRQGRRIGPRSSRKSQKKFGKFLRRAATADRFLIPTFSRNRPGELLNLQEG